MLSGVLRSPTAVAVNVQIMRAFVAMRRFLANNASVFQRLETIEYHQLEMQQHQQATDKRLDEVFRRLDEGSCKPLSIRSRFLASSDSTSTATMPNILR